MPKEIEILMRAAFDKHMDQAREIVATMSIEDKVGQMFHSMAFVVDPTGPNGFVSGPSIEKQIREKRISHFNAVGAAATAGELAQWQNQLQEIAKDAGFKVPITVSTDPRNHFSNNPGAAMQAGAFSQWPETLGLAAIGDPQLVRDFADVARQEYLAVGIRAALHPQIDLATEPRWSRASGTFGESAELTGKLAVPYIQGFQDGDELTATSVSAMTKHFPGGGPQKDGEDPHFPCGREQVYPGGQFDYHLEPFKAAIAAGTAQMMPYYGMPMATAYEEVAFGFNKGILTDLLREELGFEGIVCTDWGILTEGEILGQVWPARAWGVEHLSPKDRIVKAINAGVDQFGGEYCTEIMLEAVSEGLITEKRIDQSVQRLIAQKLSLGLFENAVVDTGAADEIVGNSDFRARGLAAQERSLTVLKNSAALPLARGVKVYVEGISPEVAAQFGTVVETPGEADFALLRFEAPFELRGQGFESFFHAGSLDFPDSQIKHLNQISDLVPTVLGIYLDRPAILTPIADQAAAIVADFGAADSAWLRVVFGDAKPEGKLPFDMPRSMAAVEASREDVPFDTENPLFKFGHGLSI
ncbi:MAG: hypothetical protein RJA35_1215 [Actinomycetota bacterium]|jgi:beta-glucosidase